MKTLNILTVEFSNNSGECLMAQEGFRLIEVKSENGDKDFFIEGEISTIHQDTVDDIVSDIAQDDMVNQLNSFDITMDIDHETFRDDQGNMLPNPKNLIPVAKVVDAKRTGEGTYVKAILNQAHPQFTKILDSIKKGFLHSFSIAFTPVKAITKIINGVKTRVLDKLNLLNVAITGVPVNKNATFSLVTKSYFQQKMTEEKKLEDSVAELKSQNEKLQAEIKSLNESNAEKEKKLVEAKSEQDEADKKELAELKSKLDEISEIKKELAEVKSVLDKVRETPVNKSQVEAKSQAGDDGKNLSVMSYI